VIYDETQPLRLFGSWSMGLLDLGGIRPLHRERLDEATDAYRRGTLEATHIAAAVAILKEFRDQLPVSAPARKSAA